MLNGFLSAFCDEELSIDGCRDFGNIRLSTEGFAGDACEDDCAVRSWVNRLDPL